MNLWERQSFTRCNSDSNQENDRTDIVRKACCVLSYLNYDLCQPYKSQISKHFIDMIRSFIETIRDSVLFNITHLM